MDFWQRNINLLRYFCNLITISNFNLFKAILFNLLLKFISITITSEVLEVSTSENTFPCRKILNIALNRVLFYFAQIIENFIFYWCYNFVMRIVLPYRVFKCFNFLCMFSCLIMHINYHKCYELCSLYYRTYIYTNVELSSCLCTNQVKIRKSACIKIHRT